MPSRYYLRNFVPGYFYHIYNRGANKQAVFKDSTDFKTFIEILAYYLIFPKGLPLSLKTRFTDHPLKVPNLDVKKDKQFTSPSIHLVAYTLMPNHFHFLIKQIGKTRDNGITNLMRRVTITYSLFTKEKYNRSGTLFEGRYKNVLVNSDSQLLHLTKYIHRNHEELHKDKHAKKLKLEDYDFSSYPVLIGKKKTPSWIHPEYILNFYSEKNPHLSYQKFVEESSVDHPKIEKVILE